MPPPVCDQGCCPSLLVLSVLQQAYGLGATWTHTITQGRSWARPCSSGTTTVRSPSPFPLSPLPSPFYPRPSPSPSSPPPSALPSSLALSVEWGDSGKSASPQESPARKPRLYGPGQAQAPLPCATVRCTCGVPLVESGGYPAGTRACPLPWCGVPLVCVLCCAVAASAQKWVKYLAVKCTVEIGGYPRALGRTWPTCATRTPTTGRPWGSGSVRAASTRTPASTTRPLGAARAAGLTVGLTHR